MAQFTNNELKREMKSRHLFMIALGGVIGSGFFNGSGGAIAKAGPLGAVISYILGGLVMYLVMLCLGELAVAMPTAGSFQDYSTRFIDPGTGFTIGWLYWFGWAATVALELTLIGSQMQRWFPSIPIWVWCLIFGIVLFIANALSARGYAETEFWFSLIKVMAIIFFIIVGAAAMFGFVPLKGGEAAPYLSNFTKHGLFPHGISAILITMLVVNFSFQGTELVGIASGESENPRETLPRAINQTVYRTILFFGLAIFVMAALIPYEKAGVLESPFVVVLDKVGVPYAADIMNFIIITAYLSVANSGLYACTRMLYSLSKNKLGPSVLEKVNQRGVPMNALIVSMAVASLSLLTYFMNAENVFNLLLTIAGSTAVFAWMSIAASQYFFRKKYLAEGGKLEDLPFRTPLYPLVPILAFVLNAITFFSQALDPSSVDYVIYAIPTVILCYVIYYLFVHKHYKAHLESQKQE